MPGILCGKYTRLNAMKSLAPIDFAARIYVGGIVFITEYNGKIINGNRMCVIAITVPVTLLISSSRFPSAIIPIQTRKSFITP